MSRRRALALALAVAATAHASSLGGGLVFDDRPAVLENPVAQQWLGPGEVLRRDYWGRLPGPTSVGTWRPLALLSLSADAALARTLDLPLRWVLHLDSWLWHLLAVAALVVAVEAHGGGRRLAASAGALFGALAVCSEAVAAVVGRADLMAAALALLAWAAHGPPPARGPDASGRRRRTLLAAALVGAALLCKESALSLPPLLVLSDRLQAEHPPALWSRRYAGLALAVAAALGLRLWCFGGPASLLRAHSNNPLLGEPWWVRALTAPRLLLLALGKMLLPIELSADYSFAEILPERSPLAPEVVAGLAALGLLLLAALRGRRGDRPLALAALLLLCAWLPSSNLVVALPVIFAERLLYLPAAGFALGCARLLERLAVQRARLAAAGLAALLLGNGVRAALADRAWRSELALFSQAVEATPRSARAWLNYALALDRAGQPQPALAAVERGLAIAPGWAALHSEAGALFDRTGQAAEAERALRRALALDGADARSAYNLALFLARHGDPAGALAVASAFAAAHPERLSPAAPLVRLLDELRARAAPALPDRAGR